MKLPLFTLGSDVFVVQALLLFWVMSSLPQAAFGGRQHVVLFSSVSVPCCLSSPWSRRISHLRRWSCDCRDSTFGGRGMASGRRSGFPTPVPVDIQSLCLKPLPGYDKCDDVPSFGCDMSLSSTLPHFPEPRPCSQEHSVVSRGCQDLSSAPFPAALSTWLHLAGAPCWFPQNIESKTH